MTFTIIITALIAVESRGQVMAFNQAEDAAGILQIRPIMVKEVNRLLVMRGATPVFKNSDRWCPGKSRRMCTIFLMHQRDRYLDKFDKEPTLTQLAVSWNTGCIFKNCCTYEDKINKHLGRAKHVEL